MLATALLSIVGVCCLFFLRSTLSVRCRQRTHPAYTFSPTAAGHLVPCRLLPAEHHTVPQGWSCWDGPHVPRHCAAVAVLQAAPRQVVTDWWRTQHSTVISKHRGGFESFLQLGVTGVVTRNSMSVDHSLLSFLWTGQE
jgi:hypothetical protein